ncbi:PilZ domain-containing protein [Desulfobulbus rhabdoformis]|uniref:PilZ domain-containing protein n=1 Tax=Desulfobulbus rhabdoformis TaxID=34032 RepID=UPI0019654F94|nr:PilZ domain-containing protein [Desulfobulbus rhabdoformis]MBM9614092.1 PilZ domain-containing protein [Desulfobulbus rhabdoformis]
MTDTLPTNNECREWSRVEKTATLQVKQLSYPLASGPGAPGILCNISDEGLCFFIETAYKEKDQLCLSIDLLGWQHHRQGVSQLVNESMVKAPLTAIAEVVWSKKDQGEKRFEIGARFVDIFEDDHKALKAYLAGIRQSLAQNL